MNILITGIHGFVGTNLVSALKNNHIIYGLDIISLPKEGVLKTFGWNELESLPSIDIIIHLAGIAHDTKNKTSSQAYFQINTGLTQKIYDWFLVSDAKKFIFFSSVKSAADKVEGDVLTENVVPSPKGPYGESKIAAENYIFSQEQRAKGTKNQEPRIKAQYSNVNVDESKESSLSTTEYLLPTNDSTNKSTYILRPCMIHGPGNKGNLNLLYQLVKKGIPYPLGAYKNRRSFTSIDNLSFVISELIEKDISGGIYNIGDDEGLSTNELITLMAKMMNKPDRIWKWNKKLIELFARVGTILHLPFNNERLQKLTENYLVSNAKLKQALGINNMPVSAKEGFLKTIKSFERK